MSVGPWMSDGGIVEQASMTMVSGSSHAAGSGVAYTSSNEGGSIDFTGAWAGASVVRATTTNANANEQSTIGYYYPLADPIEPFQYGAEWRMTWFTLTRTDVPTVTEGILPDTVIDGDGNFLDPTVTGVEWEPTSDPVGQSLRVLADIHGDIVGTDARLKVWQASDTAATATVDPGFLTAATVAAIDTLTTIPTSSSGTWLDVASPAGLPYSGPATLVVGMVDPWTQTATAPPTAPYSGTMWAELDAVYVMSQYRPRYRLIRRRVAPLRQFPRNDALAGSARRLHPVPRSRQGSNRRAGGYL